LFVVPASRIDTDDELEFAVLAVTLTKTSM
jgi:hypothetical protein